VAKPQIFNEKAGKILGFLIAYRLYTKIRIREVIIKKQIQWVLSYVQRRSADILKKNILEDLEVRTLEYAIIEKFLVDLKKEFGRENNKMMKVAELKKIE